MTLPSSIISGAINELQKICHNNSLNAGWWHDPNTGADLRGNPYVVGTKFSLIHSEVSEGLEHHRLGDGPDDKLPHRKGTEVELADAIIRILDLAEAQGYDVAGAIIEKLNFNSTREDHQLATRRKPGGKLY